MHKESLQNYATGLPHQRKQKCSRPCLPTTPTQLQARGFGCFSKYSQNLPLLWEKKKEQWFTSRYLHETDTRRTGDPVPAVLPGATTQPSCLRFAEVCQMGISPESCVKVGWCLMTSFIIKGLKGYHNSSLNSTHTSNSIHPRNIIHTMLV